MKRSIIRALALVLAVVILVMALPVTTFAASSSKCKHRKTSTKTYDTEYVANDSSTHIRLRYRKEVCKSCDRIVDQWVEEKERDHDFDNDICEDCGYKRSIADLLEEEHVIVWKNGSKTVYVEGEKTRWDYAPKNINGTTMVPVTIAVEVLGGEFLYWDPDTNSAYIEIDDEEVEYQKNNKKYWVNGKRKTANQKAQIEKSKLYVELKTLTKLTHQDVDYKDGYVFISDNGVSSKEMKKIIDYLYNGNDDEDTMLDDIKAGKIYVTSSDGKHIYKRIYDASKPCKYVDEYQNTVTCISLPKNAILTKDGNYLYENGKKICALPDVLKKAEYRINQLNRIIDGAENAYDNEVISKKRKKSIVSDTENIIEEYLAVARGEKSLSKVSEVKATYVAETGDKNSTVEEIQQKLYNLGYTSQFVNGYYGDITFNNVAYFQLVNNLNVTGWVDSDTYDMLFYEEETVIVEPENTTPYAYPTNLFEGMEVKKGWLQLNIEGNEYCDEIILNMYSYTWYNNGFSQSIRINDNAGTAKFDCTDVGEYDLIVQCISYTYGYYEYAITFSVVDTTREADLFAYFMLGMWDGTVEAGKGLSSIVMHPIKSAKSFGSGIAFVAKAIGYDGEERKALYNIWTSSGMEMLADLEDDEAKDTARKFGKFTAEILLMVAAEKGITKATTALKESAKSGKLSKVSNAWAKTGQKADDFVDDLVKGKFNLTTIFKNGKISVDDIKANPKVFSGKTVDEIADALKTVGYDVTIEGSKYSTSNAKIIKIHNTSSSRNITQIQVSPGGGRHGELPYVKISTSDQGKIKIVDGLESMYKTDGTETATIIFTGGN